MAITNKIIRQGNQHRQTVGGSTFVEVYAFEGFPSDTTDQQILVIAQNPDGGFTPTIPKKGVDFITLGTVDDSEDLYVRTITVVRRAAQTAWITVVYSNDSSWWGGTPQLTLGGLSRGQSVPFNLPVWNKVSDAPPIWERDFIPYQRAVTRDVYEDATFDVRGLPIGEGLADVRNYLTRNTNRIRGFTFDPVGDDPDVGDITLYKVLDGWSLSKRQDNLMSIRLVFKTVGSVPQIDATAIGAGLNLPKLYAFEEYFNYVLPGTGVGQNLTKVLATDLYEPWIPLPFTVDGIS